MIIRFLGASILLVFLSSCAGCALIPLSAVGSIVSLGNSSVTEGRDTYFWGALHTAEMVRFDAARAAVKSTAADLGLKPKWPEKLTADSSDMAFIDDHGSQIGIRIDRCSDKLIRLRLDVGFFGPEVIDRLFMARLRAYLPPPTAVTRPVG
jgi:hypothetical protein